MSVNLIPIILSADDTYAPFLGVTVQSIVETASVDFIYKIYILDGGISEQNKDILRSFAQYNIQIEFVDMLEYLKDVDLSVFHLSFHFSLPTYFRFFIPELFKQYDKVIYLDCDLVVLKDLSHLFDVDLKKYYLAATKDCSIIRMYRQEKSFKDYCDGILKLSNPDNYIQAGVIIFNVKEFLKANLKKKLLQKLKEIKHPLYVDQDVLNSVCQGGVKFISQNWNYTWHLQFGDIEYTQNLPQPYLAQYQAAQTDPYIVHFTGENMKPIDKPSAPESRVFWRYAAQTPYFEQLWKKMLCKQIEQIKSAKKARWKLYRYWLLMKFSFGRFHEKYLHKYNILQKKIGVYLKKEDISQ